MIAAAIVGASLVGAAAIFAIGVSGAGRSFSEALDRNNPANALATAMPQPTPTIIVRPPAVLQVRAIADLGTAQSLMSTVVEADKARVGNILYERLVLIACGRVKAGIDLSQLRDEDVTVEGDVVTVRLPRAKLLDVYLIDDASQPCTTRVYDRTNLILLPETRELESQAREKALEAIRQTAQQSGLLSDADRNARTIIERLLLNAGYQQVIFIQ
jgi:Protein of unknown function (DUF4230)